MAAVLAAFALGAQAEDPGVDWNGFYLGAQIGQGWGNDKDTEVNTTTGAPTGFAPGVGMNGIGVGAYGGYNYVLDPVLLGVEADFDDDNDIRGDYHLPSGTAYSSRVRWLTMLNLRAGVPMGEFLPYVTGGGAWSERDNIYTAGGVDQSLSNNKLGWTAGAGIEYSPAWANSFSARLEYRYVDLLHYTDIPTEVLPGVSYNHDLNMNTIMLGVSYRFNSGR